MKRLTAIGIVVVMGLILHAAHLQADVYTPGVGCLAIDPALPSTIYAGTDSGIYKTTDAGSTWGLVNSSRGIISLAIDPVTPSTLYAGHSGDSSYGILKSTDGGRSWAELDTGYSNARSTVLAIDSKSPSTLYANTFLEGNSILKSEDAGASWRPLRGFFPLDLTSVLSLVIVPGSSLQVYAGGSKRSFFADLGGVFYSRDGGLGWARENAGLPTPLPDVYAIVIASFAQRYIATSAGIFKSGAGSWSLSDSRVSTKLALDPTNASTLYAGGSSGMSKTTNGGESWTPINNGLSYSQVNAIAVDPVTPSTVYVAAVNNVYRSTDGGTSWSPIFTINPVSCSLPTSLCLGADRFVAEVSWRTADGRSGQGQAVPITSDTGYFWFFSPANVELAVKVLDGTSVNGQFWVFAGALSDVEYSLVVTDRLTGEARYYYSPRGQLSSFADTSAFPGTGGSAVQAIVASTVPSISATAYLGLTEACTTSPATLCLNGARFKVDVAWRTKDGRSGVGRAAALSADTGYFWFFNASNVELVVKVLDGRSYNGHYWVFYGALSDVAYTITVTDTETGIVRTYDNPQGTLASHADTEAF